MSLRGTRPIFLLQVVVQVPDTWYVQGQSTLVDVPSTSSRFGKSAAGCIILSIIPGTWLSQSVT